MYYYIVVVMYIFFPRELSSLTKDTNQASIISLVIS